jgi:hypothetical protein
MLKEEYHYPLLLAYDTHDVVAFKDKHIFWNY